MSALQRFPPSVHHFFLSQQQALVRRKRKHARGRCNTQTAILNIFSFILNPRPRRFLRALYPYCHDDDKRAGLRQSFFLFDRWLVLRSWTGLRIRRHTPRGGKPSRCDYTLGFIRWTHRVEARSQGSTAKYKITLDVTLTVLDFPSRKHMRLRKGARGTQFSHHTQMALEKYAISGCKALHWRILYHTR